MAFFRHSLLPQRRTPLLCAALAVASLELLVPRLFADTNAPAIPSTSQAVHPAAPTLPRLPSTRISLTEFGGVADGKTLNTDAFARAFEALSQKGGGTLVVPAGIWLTGPIRFRSHCGLHLDAGALLKFSEDYRLYPLRVLEVRGEKSVETTSPILGEKLEDISITGEGVIDGGGRAWRYIKRIKVTQDFWKKLIASGGVLNAKADEWWPSEEALRGRQRVADLVRKGSLDLADYEPAHLFLRPRLLQFIECRRVLIEGVSFHNAPNWTLHPLLCEDLTLSNLKILNPSYAQNSDAMDLESCARVVVRGCLIDTGDDAICIKSGINEAGRRIGVATSDVLVENCVVFQGHGGFVIGSEMSGGVHDVLVRNLTFIGTDTGLRFKTARGRGGVVRNIQIENIRMTGIEGDPINFNFLYAGGGEASSTPPPVTEGTPEFRDMVFENIISTGSKGSLTLRGLPEKPLSNITLRHISISAQSGADIAYCDGMVFDDVQLRCAEGPPLKTKDVAHSRLELAE